MEKITSLVSYISCNFLKGKLSFQCLNLFLHFSHYAICFGCFSVRKWVTLVLIYWPTEIWKAREPLFITLRICTLIYAREKRNYLSCHTTFLHWNDKREARRLSSNNHKLELRRVLALLLIVPSVQRCLQSRGAWNRKIKYSSGKEGRHEALRNVSQDWLRKWYTNNGNNEP